MAKYSKGAQKSVESSMKRMEKGKLESGRSGKKVTNPKQAIAIGLSEARKKGAKVPAKKTVSKAASKATPKKAAAKKTAPKKAAAKKSTAPKKSVAKASPKKAVAKKTTAPPKAAAKAPVKAVVKKSTPKKTPAKKAAPKKAPAKKVFADKNLNKKSAGTNVNNEETSVPEYNETVGKVANVETGSNTNDNNTNSNEPQIKDDGLKAPEKIEDPVTAADQKGYNKATTKGDPHQKLHLSQAKGGIKPSGKKPLWNR